MSNSNELPDGLKALISGDSLPQLGPGPRAGCLSTAEIDARVSAATEGLEITEAGAELVRSLIYLWHDHLDASHTISQAIHDARGSYLHGVMHRREPDYGNAKYWFHRAGFQPIFSSLCQRAEAAANESGGRDDLAHLLMSSGEWDPTAFVDLCADLASQADDHPDVVTLKAIQQAEFELLMADYLTA